MLFTCVRTVLSEMTSVFATYTMPWPRPRYARISDSRGDRPPSRDRRSQRSCSTPAPSTGAQAPSAGKAISRCHAATSGTPTSSAKYAVLSTSSTGPPCWYANNGSEPHQMPAKDTSANAATVSP